MTNKIIFALLLLFQLNAFGQQKVIDLFPGAAPGSESWTYHEKEYINNDWKQSVVYNVSHPSLTVYPADPAIATGTAMIVCPGGGFFVLKMKEEGTDVAKWLNQKGITVFILKYRLGQSQTDDPVRELNANMQKPDFVDKIKDVVPLCIADGKEAIKYVRLHAGDYGIAPNRIGIIGFSAGGTVAASSAFNYTPENRPDFVAPIYAFMPENLQPAVPADAPPLFITAASDDQLGLVPHSISLFSKWNLAKHYTEIHIYEKGGHGFGTHKQNIPTDTWMDRLGDWLGAEGFLKPIDPKVVANLDQMDKNTRYADYLLRKDWANIKRYSAADSTLAAPLPDEKRVVFMGNSITDGWINADPSFFNGKPYYDRGISGQTTGQMLVRFREDVINLKPTVVVILAGINDIAQNNGPTKLEDTFGNIASMAELAQANHIKVVISSVLPAIEIPWRKGLNPGPKVARLNAMLKAYCEKNNLVYLDYFTAMADDKKGLPLALSGDGVHPNLAGYKMMEPLAEKAIEEALKR